MVLTGQATDADVGIGAFRSVTLGDIHTERSMNYPGHIARFNLGARLAGRRGDGEINTVRGGVSLGVDGLARDAASRGSGSS